MSDQKSREISLALNKISASQGSALILSGAPWDVEAKAFYVREDTVITAITGKKPGNGPVAEDVDFDAEVFFLGGATLFQGDLFIAPDGYIITSIELASGSIIIYS